MQLTQIRMTLTGPYAGRTMTLNGRQFVDGVHDVVDQEENARSIVKYYQRCWQVKLSDPAAEPEQVFEEPEPEQTDPDPQEDDEVEPDEPNERQVQIIAAINGIDREEWIEQETNPHPKVADVSTLMEDPTVTKDEICEVIEKWLS